MPLSWNEIKARALAFSKEWEHETSEDAEAKSFWDGFFHVFDVSRRRLATFETAVRKGDNKQGFIDLLWKGVILVEYKSRGKDLDKAFQQAKDYFPGLKEHELPKYILVSDFERFKLYDLDTGAKHEFQLRELSAHVHLFGFMAGYQKRSYKDEDPVNIEAAERMGKLHDTLEAAGYKGHALEVYLVRVLFCLFAEDTGIFERTQFQELVDNYTKPDGSDLALQIAQLFQTLNTPKEDRFKTLDETLAAFPYVNGKLFEENLPLAAFDTKMRESLLLCCALDWSKISPAIFGSMFQAVMNPKERRNLGAHYTSEKNIQKVIKSLFLDDLYAEFEKARDSQPKLIEFQNKIASLKFLDPACGCGNFLIISYRELRELEIKVLREIFFVKQKKRPEVMASAGIKIDLFVKVNVDQFAGIEYDEFPARIAEVAMWLVDHQMNLKVSDEFGQYFVRLPLNKAAKILHGNALRVDWSDIVPKEQLNFILGNPPFIGAKLLTDEQKSDVALVFKDISSNGVLDYVTCWYRKSVDLMTKNPRIRTALVSTNSITQGEQVSILWGGLLNRGLKIHFAHRTFLWSNEAKGNAAVHCVIIGFGLLDVPNKWLFEYETLKSEPYILKVKHINPYLIDANDTIVQGRMIPLCEVPPIVNGSIPADGGNLILEPDEKESLLQKDPDAAQWIRVYLGGEGFINNITRHCLWLVNCAPEQLRKMPEVMKRISAVKEMRLASTKAATREKANYPSLFTENRQPTVGNYLAIPRTSSENRRYIPFGFLSAEVIAANDLQLVPNANVFHFGILSSIMHMAWVKVTAGRLKSDYRYSTKFTYNTFPWPQTILSQKQKVEEAAQVVLDTRAKYPGSSLADLYDPVTMPPDLVKAHQALDKAVDLCYRPQAFGSELARIEFLFGLYEQYTAPMFGSSTSNKKESKPK